MPDALATAANLLRKNGWQSRQDLGLRGRRCPAGGKFPSGSMTLSKWQSLGVDARQRQGVQERRRQGRTEGAGRPRRTGLPDDEELLRAQSATTMPTNMRWPSAFLPTRSPAMAGLCATGIGPSPSSSSRKSRNCRSGCPTHGYYDGKFDGKIGEGSRSAIKAFQAQAGLTPDGHPSMEVLSELRKR